MRQWIWVIVLVILSLNNCDDHPDYPFLNKAPILVSPPNLTIIDTVASPNFEWQSVAGAYSYEIFVNDISCGVVDETTTVVPLNCFSNKSKQIWKVRGLNLLQSGPFSEEFQFNIPPNPPPFPVSPINNQTVCSMDVELEWDYGFSVSSMADVQISVESDFYPLYLYKNMQPGTTWIPDSTLPDGNYFWRLRGNDQLTSMTSWSAPATFSIVTPPNNFTIDTVIDTCPSDDFFVTWQPEPGYTHDVELYNPLSDEWNTPDYITNNYASQSGLTIGNGYKWRIRAVLDTCQGDWIESNTADILTGTLKGVNLGSTPVGGNTPYGGTLTWTSTGASTEYLVEISDGSGDFSNPSFSWQGTDLTVDFCGLSSGTYFWRVTPLGFCTQETQTSSSPFIVSGSTPIVYDNLTLHYDAASATCAGPGNNSPLTTTLYDLTNNGHDGELLNFAGTTASGYAGDGSTADPYRIVMDGTADQIRSSPVQNVISAGTFAIEVWVRSSSATGIGSDVDRIITLKRNAGSDFISLTSMNNNCQYHIHDGVTGAWIDTGHSCSNGGWVQFLVSFDGDEYSSYINGASAGTPQSLLMATPSSENIQIGTFNNVQYWKGDIAIVRIYDGMLTQTQVLQNCQAMANRFQGFSCS